MTGSRWPHHPYRSHLPLSFGPYVPPPPVRRKPGFPVWAVLVLVVAIPAWFILIGWLSSVG